MISSCHDFTFTKNERTEKITNKMDLGPLADLRDDQRPFRILWRSPHEPVSISNHTNIHFLAHFLHNGFSWRSAV